MERHIALLIDLLGFSDAVLTSNTQQTDSLLKFVRRIATLQGRFNLDGEAPPDGGLIFRSIRPEVTTFSDLLFLSFPLPEVSAEVPPVLTQIIADMWLQEVERWTGVIAVEALKIGMLIRGGLALGALYHDQTESVTFGPALVQAHELESRDAVYPRVLLSRELRDKLSSDPKQRLLRDKDGLLHLDYFKPMFDHAIPKGPRFLDDARAWLNINVGKIEANSAALSDRGRLRQASKWDWFKSELVDAAKRRGI